MKHLLAVGVGGFFGAVARYLVSLAAARVWNAPFPIATFAVNVIGCFALAYFATWASARPGLDPAWRLFVATGIVGAFTTFSTFEYETHLLVEGRASGWAALNVFASVSLGYVAALLGARMAVR